MWTSTPLALTALLSLSNFVLAQEATEFTTVVVMSTVTVLPLPMSTATETFPSIASDSAVASGIFYPGTASGSGSSYALPTGYHCKNRTGNHTRHHHHHHHHGKNSTSSIPFFTLNNTDIIVLPTLTASTSPSSAPVTLTSSASTTSEMSISPSILTSSAEPTSLSASSPSSSSSSSLSTSSIIEVSSTSTPEPSSTMVSKPISPPSTITTTTGNSNIPFLRGVNLGGWFVLEKWMTPDVFSGRFADAKDQYTFDSIPGAEAALKEHWDTFFTESDFRALAATGINALRIPIGYWSYDNSGTPYISGADAYLEKAIGWARSLGMKVWVDCHGSPGSQNGFDHSGHAGDVNWQQSNNQDRSIDVLKTMAKKYGAQEYADVVVGLELVNEPISYGNNKFSITKDWAQQAYKAVKDQVENENMVIVMHDAFEGAMAWTNVAKGLLSNILTGQSKTFGIDSHLYQIFSDDDKALDQAQHITKACGWGADLKIANAIMPTYVGEWSATTDICVKSDGSTIAGNSCSDDGCQCSSNISFDDWNDNLIKQTRKYVEAQLDVFESSTHGWFIWAAKAPGGWGYMNGVEKGIIPQPLTSRKYPGQCGLGLKRREIRGSLGRVEEAW